MIELYLTVLQFLNSSLCMNFDNKQRYTEIRASWYWDMRFKTRRSKFSYLGGWYRTKICSAMRVTFRIVFRRGCSMNSVVRAGIDGLAHSLP
jgi:hypothetical protein